MGQIEATEHANVEVREDNKFC